MTTIDLFELRAMSEHQDPDHRITELLALLDAFESFPEKQQFGEQSSPQTPDIDAEPIEGENRFAAKVVSGMSKGRAR